MIRKTLFWVHLSAGVTAGLFIFIMAATGVLLAFERQILDWADRDVRSVSVPQDGEPRTLNDQLNVVRRADVGAPSAVVVRHAAQAATQFSIGRGKTVYVDPYSGAVLGAGSDKVRQFFSSLERLHRSLGAPNGSKGLGHWLAAVANLLFGLLIVLGVFLWMPRKWNWKTLRLSGLLRFGLRGRAREWNWHNAIGIWCAAPLFVIVLTGVVMSYDWANTLLFKLSGSPVPVRGRPGDGRQARGPRGGNDPNYDNLFAAAAALNPEWRTITMNVGGGANEPVPITVDAGTGGEPQKRTQYLLNRETATVLKTSTFADNSLGQRLRTFVRFGHTGEYGGIIGQVIAALVSLGACFLAYTGISLAIRRLFQNMRLKRKLRESLRVEYPEEEPVS